MIRAFSGQIMLRNDSTLSLSSTRTYTAKYFVEFYLRARIAFFLVVYCMVLPIYWEINKINKYYPSKDFLLIIHEPIKCMIRAPNWS